MLKIFSIIVSSLYLFSCSTDLHMPRSAFLDFRLAGFDHILNLIIKILIIVVLLFLIKKLYDTNNKNKKDNKND